MARRFASLLCVFGVFACAASAQNLLSNGSFETGDFSGWTTGGNFEFTTVISGPYYAYSGAQDGNFYAVMGPVGGDGTLSQTFADNAGTLCTLSFWLAARACPTGSSRSASRSTPARRENSPG